MKGSLASVNNSFRRTTFDDLATRRRQLAQKPFLKRILMEWYRMIAKRLGGNLPGPVLEIGSGPGFLEKVFPILRSEIFFQPEMDLLADGSRLPIRDKTLGGLVLINVLHHLPSPRNFFREAARCLAHGGRLLLVEPWGGWWASLVYRAFHTERFDAKSPAWEESKERSLNAGNNALPWILFRRDQKQTLQELENLNLELKECRPFQPFLYLASGGIGSHFSLPLCLFRPIQLLERFVRPWNEALGMFVFLHLQRR